jgi:hypothetical protein
VLPPRDKPVLAADAPIEKVRVPEVNVSVDAEIYNLPDPPPPP